MIELENAIHEYLKRNGVFLYINTGKTEPTFIAGMGRPASTEDLDAAIRFIETIKKLRETGEA